MEVVLRFIPEEDLKFETAVSMMSEDERKDWGLLTCNIEKFWALSKGANILVGILDTGIVQHDDLSYLPGVNCTGDDSFIDHGSGHGVHVAGIIAARENGKGIVGIAPECTILPIKVLDSNGSGSYGSIAKGLRAAIDANCDIINMSLGAPSEPPAEIHEMIKEAAAKGIIIVAAAGNDAGAVNYPARYDEVIAVAAMDHKGNLANFSSRGTEVDGALPGVDIYSTHFHNGYAVMSGTSQASPFMAGMCALLLSYSRCNAGTLLIKNYVDMLQELKRICTENPFVTAGDIANWGYGVPSFCNIDPDKFKSRVIALPIEPNLI